LNNPANQGAILYIVPFLLIFCETGLFFTPFLPGDSLVFAVGALVASGGMDLRIVAPVAAAVAELEPEE
jgi:membrane-associated protein